MIAIKIGLLPRIIIAIVLGICLGNLLPEWATRVFVTLNGLFGEFLKFLIPLIILGLVTVAISDIGRGASKMLIVTALLSYALTVVAGLVAYATGATVFPSLISGGTSLDAAMAADLTPYFTVSIPPLMNVMTALFLAFTLGIGMGYVGTDAMKSVAREFSDIIGMTIRSIVIPLLPLYIFGIFANMTATGAVWGIITVFIKVIGVIFVLHILLLLFDYCMAGLVTRRNPLKLLYNMLPAYFTALGTSSSAATIPVTLAQAKKNGVSDSVAGFTIPLCATIHLSGSAMKITACALALMMMQQMTWNFELFFPFILMLGILMVAAPGVPGGAIMASLAVLQQFLGFGEQEQALMISLYVAMDSFGTACNVTGDGAIALVMDKLMGDKNKAH